MLAPDRFFDTSLFAHGQLFAGTEHVWEALHRLADYLTGLPAPDLGRRLPAGVPLPAPVVVLGGEVMPAADCRIEYGDTTRGGLVVQRHGAQLAGASVLMAGAVLTGERIFLGRGVLVESGAFLRGPVLLGDHTEVRQGAYVRGYCLTGARCVVGHVTEMKKVIMLDDAKAGHFAYLGDSILGNRVNLGAGTKLANLRFVKGNVTVRTPNGPVDTGLRKLGAILGDDVMTGCNTVTNPGALMGRGGVAFPNTTVPSGLHPERAVVR
ncbi:MAG: hypothetical protein AB1634_10675 [Thermodesulfobacteriota bacterium]